MTDKSSESLSPDYCITGPAITPSLLAKIKPPPEEWKPPRKFLSGLGQPWEPEPWECEDSEDEELLKDASMLLEDTPKAPASTLKKKVCDSRWGSPKTSSDIKSIQKAGIPSKTIQQTEWCLSVWKDWTKYRRDVHKDPEEANYELKEAFCDMDIDSMNFWLCRFVVEARKKNGSKYPPNSVYQLCYGLNRALIAADSGDVKMFDDSHFTAFKGTLDSKMKELKGTGKFECRKADVICDH